MAFQKWKLSNQASSLGILSTLLTSCTLLFSEPDPQPPELDEEFNKEPFSIGYVAYPDSLYIRVSLPRWSILNYCVRSFCGYVDQWYTPSVFFLVALDDTVSILWSNRSGDTLRTLVQIDRDWFTDGFVVVGDTLRIRRPKGAVGPFSVVVWGKAGSGRARGTLLREEELLELIAPSPGDWAELHLVELMRDDFFRDTIATNPVQYVEFVRYEWRSTLCEEGRCPGCLRP